MKRIKMLSVVALSILLSFPAATAYAADYKVTANDSLYSISQLFKTDTATLQQTNSLNGDNLASSQKIYVPAHVHKVQSGDTMYLVSAKYGISLSSLRKANNKWNDSLVVGQKLIIPGVKPSKSTDAVIPYYSGEVDLLARLIEAEASGESMKAKIAVGAVVVNRVQSKDWASTIKGVIYQKYGEYYQFTPVKNGMINKPASTDSIRAAWTALFGSDPSNGAIYYFDQSSKNQWLWSKTQTAAVDHMVFVK